MKNLRTKQYRAKKDVGQKVQGLIITRTKCVGQIVTRTKRWWTKRQDPHLGRSKSCIQLKSLAPADSVGVPVAGDILVWCRVSDSDTASLFIQLTVHCQLFLLTA
jgi:hypothetical protein